MISTARIVTLALVTITGCGAIAASEPSPFVAEELAEFVYLMRPAEDRPELSNSLLVLRQDGPMVIDAQATPAAARELLAAVAGVDPRPVRYLILSHAHAEAAGGAAAFPEETLVISSVGARDALDDPEFDFAAELARRAPELELPGPADRRRPVLVVQARTELEDARVKVDFFPLGQTHSTSDLVVLLPASNILYAGAVLFVDGNPYAGDARIDGWVSALNYLAKIRPAIAVPLRGAPVDVRGIRLSRESLAWLRGQVELAFIDAVPSGRIPDRVLASEEISRYFQPDQSPSFVRGLVEQAVEEAIEQRRKRGIE